MTPELPEHLSVSNENLQNKCFLQVKLLKHKSEQIIECNFYSNNGASYKSSPIE